MEEAAVLRHPREPSLAPPGSGRESRAVTRPGGDDAAGRAGHSWPLPARSPTPLAWVTAPAKLSDTETPQGLRVSGTILRLMGSDSSAPPPSAPSLHASPGAPLSAQPAQGALAARRAHRVAPEFLCVARDLYRRAGAALWPGGLGSTEGVETELRASRMLGEGLHGA